MIFELKKQFYRVAAAGDSYRRPDELQDQGDSTMFSGNFPGNIIDPMSRAKVRWSRWPKFVESDCRRRRRLSVFVLL